MFLQQPFSFFCSSGQKFLNIILFSFYEGVSFSYYMSQMVFCNYSRLHLPVGTKYSNLNIQYFQDSLFDKQFAFPGIETNESAHIPQIICLLFNNPVYFQLSLFAINFDQTHAFFVGLLIFCKLSQPRESVGLH